jgi:hypothetical protein
VKSDATSARRSLRVTIPVSLSKITNQFAANSSPNVSRALIAVANSPKPVSIRTQFYASNTPTGCDIMWRFVTLLAASLPLFGCGMMKERVNRGVMMSEVAAGKVSRGFRYKLAGAALVLPGAIL